MERNFTFPKSAKAFYSYWKEKIRPTHWQAKLDRLADQKMSWSDFFDSESVADHPALELSTTKGGHSLLHLAVIQDQPLWQAKLAKVMSDRLNEYGLSAAEVGQLIGRSVNPQKLHVATVPNLILGDPEKIEQLSFDYLDNPIFESAETLDFLLERTAWAKSSDQIPGEKIWMGIYFNKEVKKGFHPEVSLQWIGDSLGFGIFAAQKISACTLIGEYTGLVKECTRRSTKDNYYCVQYTTWGIRRRKFVIDAKIAGNFTRFINHSHRPNLGLQSIYWSGLPRMVLVSLQEIEAGTQLTFDYGMKFWKESPQPPIRIT